ncbi:MAG: ROK family protein [Bacteroidaceae bacterium]|nr:ROK family protein [Bacteroidaceae bacterium]
MDYSNDKRVVMTLDAGGTNFIFSAIQGNKEILEPVRLPSGANNLEICLKTLEEGFNSVKERLIQEPIAISFAFPGPADYVNGVIGDLPNLPAFRGGVALKAFLEKKFGIPVFINNDGNLFAYGEALSGMLPALNKALEASGNPHRYQNLIGITLGTGFGAGVVLNGELLLGDNGCGGDVWVFRDKYYPEMIAEESVSIHAVKRMYAEFSGENRSELTPKDICDIADGRVAGDQAAARKTFVHFGKGLGNALCYALTLIDGVVVIGGGLAGAHKYFFPAMLEEMNGQIGRFEGGNVPRLQMDVYDMTNPEQMAELLKPEMMVAHVPETKEEVPYQEHKKTGVDISTVDTSFVINLGAYNFALNELDKIK